MKRYILSLILISGNIANAQLSPTNPNVLFIIVDQSVIDVLYNLKEDPHEMNNLIWKQPGPQEIYR